MRVLVVYCHPVPESFCAALRDTALQALKAASHEVRLLDLYAENFDPVMTASERRGYNLAAPSDPVLQRHGALIHWANAIVFVYPTWWYGLPAMLKGWLDRVWAKDVAFGLAPGDGAILPLMTHVGKIGVVTTCGASQWLSFLVGQPGRKTLLRGLRTLCARTCRTVYMAHYDMDASTPATRSRYLRDVRRKLERF